MLSPMDIDRYMLLTFGLVFAVMSLFTPRAIRTGRTAGASGIARSEDPPFFWLSVLLPPAAAVAALGYFAAGGSDLTVITHPLILLFFGVVLVSALQTGRIRGWYASREETPRAFWAMIAMLAFSFTVVAIAWAVRLLDP